MVLVDSAQPPTSEPEASESYSTLSPSLLHCMTYIDTQGMSLPSNGNVDNDIQYTPMPVKKMTVFTDMEREELKQMMREVLNEYA